MCSVFEFHNFIISASLNDVRGELVALIRMVLARFERDLWV